MIDEINGRYINLEKEVTDKYAPSLEEITATYNTSSEAVNTKYDALEEAISKKYKELEASLKTKKNDLSVAENKEFFANGLSKKYYTLSDQISEVNEQIRNLDKDKDNEIRNNESLRNEELATLENTKSSSLSTIENNKNAELNRLKEKKNLELIGVNRRNTDKTEKVTIGVTKIVSGGVIILLPLLYLVIVYNKLTNLSNIVKEKWSQVEISLKRRSDLIPNILESVKGYSKHEKKAFESITKARSNVVKAKGKEEEIEANTNLNNELTKFLMIIENYPELKANTNFMDLQTSLKQIENDISECRGLYNKAVLHYKNKLEMFPSNIVANVFDFKPELFFDFAGEDGVRISFD